MTFYLCFSISFVLAITIAKPFIRFLRSINSIQKFREQGPQSHIEDKAGTPTMGAWIFLLPVFVVMAMLYYEGRDLMVLLVLAALAVGALMGSVDDLLKILKSNYRGLDSKQKLLVQFVVSSAIAYFSGRYLFADINPELPSWMTPLLIAWEFVWAFCVIAGASNAINLSDGLDGLATMLSILAYGALGIYLWMNNDFSFVAVAITIVAALSGFLLFNFKPAQVFMGDTGSLALGMGLGALAYLTKLEWYLLVFALVPVLETLSVIIQVISAKLSRRFLNKDIRVFKMAPLHHHFELSGWDELRVVISFVVLQLIISLLFLGWQILQVNQQAIGV